MGQRIALIELHAAVLLFGISGLFGKWIPASPVAIVFGRTAFAALAIFVGLRMARSSLDVGSRRVLALMIFSGAVLALHWVTFFHSIQIATVAVGLVGFATFPVFVTFLEPAMFGNRLCPVDLVCAAIVFVGLVLVAPSFDMSDAGTIGLLWAVLSGFLFAVLTLVNRRLVRRCSFIVVAFYQHSSAALVLVPFAIALTTVPDLETVSMIAVLGIVCTALPQTLFIKSLTEIRAQLASVVTGLEPVYGIVFAAILLDEIPDGTTAIGAAFVFFAVILAMRVHSLSGGAVPKGLHRSDDT